MIPENRVSFRGCRLAFGLVHGLLIPKGMETKNKSFKLAFLSLLAVLHFGCSNGSSDSGTTSTTATSYYMNNGSCYSNTGQQVAISSCNAGYYSANGYCYSSSTGQIVDGSYCSSSTGYYMSNGYCYSSYNGQIVNSTYCGSTGTGTGIVAQTCVGYYVWVTASGSQVGYCNGTNCRGYTLYPYGSQQAVYCQ